jgi:hypothetical protein
MPSTGSKKPVRDPNRPSAGGAFLIPDPIPTLISGGNMHEEDDPGPTRSEEFKLDGGQVLDKIKALIHEGNIRRIIVKNEDGKTLIEIPLTFGLVGIALLPIYAAVGAIAAVATRMVIVVEKAE